MSIQLLGLPEPLLRLSVFLGLLGLLMAAERLWPRKTLRLGLSRWPANLAMVLIGSALLRLMAVLSTALLAVGAAAQAQAAGSGLLRLIAMPEWLAVLLGVLLLDALIYAQHRLFHRLPWLWRIHRMHHADVDFDVTTALRFHPLEIALSMLIKVAAVWLLGVPVVAVVLFEILLNGCAMFNHANLRLPLAVDRPLRYLLVTPDMHRVHHSLHADEHHRNFGFCLALWDRLFGSYRAAPREGHVEMLIGLPEYQQANTERLAWCLWLPFAGR